MMVRSQWIGGLLGVWPPVLEQERVETMYNGYESQDAFHEAMQAAWREILSTPEGRAQHERDYGPGSTSHAQCDHAYGYCVQGGE